MEKFSASGDCTSNHLSQTPNNTVPLDTILKDKEILLYEGAFESDWKQSSTSLQNSNGQNLAQLQDNNTSCFRKSTVSVQRQTGQSTAVLMREYYPQHGSKHFCSNDRPPENSLTGEEHLLQKCPIKLSSSSFECQSATCASTTTNTLEQSMPQLVVLSTKNPSERWKNSLHNQSQHMKITNNFPKDSICQGLFTDVGHFGVILAKGQAIKLHQQNASMSKDVYQQKCAPQKAIAVVTPLTQQIVADVTFTKSSTSKVKQGGLETRPVTNTHDHQPYTLLSLQPTINESGAKSLCDSQTNKVQSESVQATGFSHCIKDSGPAEHKNIHSQKEGLSSVPLNSASTERKEVEQPYPNCSVTFLSKDDATVMGRNSEGMETRMDGLSIIPVKEWSLQRLRTLITDLEQMEKKQQKEVPFNDLTCRILKMYWNRDPIKLCNAVKSNGYASIIENVGRHRGNENSVIFHEVSREKLNELASRFHILKHGMAPPKMVYTSSWLNLSQELRDTDKEDDCLSSLMTMHQNAKVTEKEVPMKEMANKQESTDEKTLRGEEKRNKQLPPRHQQILSVKGEKMVGKEPVDINNVRKEEDNMAVTNVSMQRAQLEKRKTRGEKQVLVSSSPQSSDVSDSCAKPGNLLILSTRDVTPALDEKSFECCTPADTSLLPPEKTGRLLTGKLDEKVENMQKEGEQISTDSKGQVTVELVGQDKKRIDPEVKLDKMSSRIKIYWQLESYCCLAQWFQVLGYRNRGVCKCEQKVEPSHHADTLGKGVKNVNADKHTHPSNRTTLTHTDICELRDNRQAETRPWYRNMTGKKSVCSSVDGASVDEIMIVDVVTNYEDVLEMANVMSDQLMETPLVAHTSTGRKHHVNHNPITTPPVKRGGTLINLTLFGSSRLSQKKGFSGFNSSEKMQLPPERINVILSGEVDSGGNEHPNSTESQTTKQQVWNSWKKTFVPLSTKNKSKNQKTKTDAEGNSAFEYAEDLKTYPCKNTSADQQRNTHRADSNKKCRKRIRSTTKDEIRKLKLNKMLASFNLNRRVNYANNRLKPTKSSFERTQVVNPSKNKLNTGSALNFGVLPESFTISGSSSSMEVNQAAADDRGKDSII